jgi:hypothetical protein
VTDLLSTGAEWLRGVLTSHASQSVTYGRQSTAVTVTATLARTEWELDGEAVSIEWEGRDFLIDVSDLSSEFNIPQRGDWIRHGDNTYEVQAPEGFAVWQYWDRYQKKFRVHTVLIDGC